MQGGAGNDIVIATNGALTSGDVINGGGGTNTLQLSGGGIFNLSVPDIFTNMQVVTVHEGSGTAAQTVTLRDGTAMAVNVAAAATSPTTAGVTIYGAQNKDVISLGAGKDLVYLGVGETLKGGSGAATVHVTTDTAGNSISGGTGSMALVVDGGGDVILGKAVTKASTVTLATTTNFTANALAGMKITGSAAGGDHITLGAATQRVVGGGANETVLATAAFGGAAVSGLGANSTLEIITAGKVKLNAATSVTQVKMDAIGQLTLNGMQFITAIGGSTGDTILAGGANQTLTSLQGGDTLVGYAGGGDIFSATPAGLSSDLIRNFTSTDTIDITNLACTGATLKSAISGGNTGLLLTSGVTSTRFMLAGSFAANGFRLASDGMGGTLITHA